MVIGKTWYFEHPCFLDRELYIWDCLGKLIRSPEKTTETCALTDQPLWCVEEPSSVCITVSHPESPRDSENLLEGRLRRQVPSSHRAEDDCTVPVGHKTMPMSITHSLLSYPRLPWEVFAELLHMHQYMYTWRWPPHVERRKSVSYGLTMVMSDGPPWNLNQSAPLIRLFEVKHSARMDSQCTR